MNLITMAEASRLDYAPSKPGITKYKNKDPRPVFFHDTEAGTMIDVDDPAWIELIENRKNKHYGDRGQRTDLRIKKKIAERKKQAAPSQEPVPDKPPTVPPPRPAPEPAPVPKQTKKPPQIKYTISSSLEDLDEQAMKAKLLEPILKTEELEQKVEMRKLQLKKQASELIEYQLAEFLFFGYLERINMELLGITKKLAPTIDNLVKEKKPDAILKLLDREFEKMLIEAKTAQKEDVKKWKEER